MDVIGIIGCILGFVLVIFLSFKNFSPFIASCIGAFFVILITGSPIVDTLTTYASNCASFAAGYWLVFLFGAIMARIYSESGAAMSVAVGLKKWVLRDKLNPNVQQFLALLVIGPYPRHPRPRRRHNLRRPAAVLPDSSFDTRVLQHSKRFSYGALCLGCFSWCILVPAPCRRPTSFRRSSRHRRPWPAPSPAG